MHRIRSGIRVALLFFVLAVAFRMLFLGMLADVASGDSTAQALSFGRGNSTIYLSNTDPDSTAAVFVDLFPHVGGGSIRLQREGVGPEQVVAIDLEAETQVPAGAYSARVASEGISVAAFAHSAWPDGGASAGGGIGRPSRELLFGYASKELQWQSSLLSVHNPLDQPVEDLVLDVYPENSEAPLQTRFSIAARQTEWLDLGLDVRFSGIRDGNRAWLRLRSDEPVFASAQLWPTSDRTRGRADLIALSPNELSAEHVIPLYYWGWGPRGLESYIFVLNPGPDAVSATLSFEGMEQACAGQQYASAPVQIEAEELMALRGDILPYGCIASARLVSSGAVAVSKAILDGNHVILGQHISQTPSQANRRTLIPLVRKQAGPQDGTTAIHAANVSAEPATLTLHLRDQAGQTISCDQPCLRVVPAGKAARWDLNEIPEFPMGASGSAIVEGDQATLVLVAEADALGDREILLYGGQELSPSVGLSAEQTLAFVMRIEPATPTPTATLTPSQTPTATPTFTRLPTLPASATPTALALPPSPTALPRPPSRGVGGPELEADLVEILGGDRSWLDLVHAPDFTLLYQDSQIFSLELRESEPQVLGRMLLRRNQLARQQMQRAGDTLVVAEQSLARLIDLQDPARMHELEAIRLRLPARHVAPDGARVFLAGDGIDEDEVWLSGIQLRPDGSGAFVGEVKLDVERVSHMLAGDGLLALAVQTSLSDPTSERWRLYNTLDFPQLELLYESGASGQLMDLENGRLLVIQDDGLQLLDLSSPSSPVELARWTVDSEFDEVHWAQFSGEEIFAAKVLRQANGNITDIPLHRLILDSQQELVSLEQIAFTERPIWTGIEAPCFVPEGKRRDDSIVCLDAAWSPSTIVPSLLPSDGEIADLGGCQPEIGLMDSSFLAHCLGALRSLQDDGSGSLRGSEAAAFDRGASLDGRFWRIDDGLFAHSGDNLIKFERRAGELVATDTGIQADEIVTQGNRLVVEWTGWLRVYDASTLALNGEVRIPNVSKGRGPYIDGDRVYFYWGSDGWFVADLSDPQNPRPLPAAFDFPFHGFGVRNDIAYVAVEDRSNPNRHRVMLQIYRLEEEPVLLSSMEVQDTLPLLDIASVLGTYLIGDILYIDRGAGWVSRLSIEDPLTPRLLEPQAFPVNNQISGEIYMQLSDIGGRPVVRGERGDLMIYEASSEAPARVAQTWSPWNFLPTAGQLEVRGDHLLVGQQRGNRSWNIDYWQYTLASPEKPRRMSRLALENTPRMRANDSRLITLAGRGHELRIYEAGTDRVPHLVGKWCHLSGLCNVPNERSRPIAAFTEADGLVYALSRYGGELLILDIRDPKDIRSIGSWRIEGLKARDMELIGSRLFISHPDQLPFQVDVSDPLAPRPLGPLSGLPGAASFMTAQDETLFLAIGSELVILNANRTGAITIVASLEFGTTIRKIQLSQSRLLVVLDDRLWLMDAQQPEALVALGFLTLPEPGSAAMKDGTIYYQGARREIEVLANLRPKVRTGAQYYLPAILKRR